MVAVVLALTSTTLAPLSTLPITRGVPGMNCRPAIEAPPEPETLTLERITAPPRRARVPRSMRVAPL
ncbi:hypothetical protein D3C86_2131760 [compost metagenome]